MIDRGTLHVVPVADIFEHETDLSGCCVCGPSLEAVPHANGSTGWLYTHHALDGRELTEQNAQTKIAGSVRP